MSHVFFWGGLRVRGRVGAVEGGGTVWKGGAEGEENGWGKCVVLKKKEGGRGREGGWGWGGRGRPWHAPLLVSRNKISTSAPRARSDKNVPLLYAEPSPDARTHFHQRLHQRTSVLTGMRRRRIGGGGGGGRSGAISADATLATRGLGEGGL